MRLIVLAPLDLINNGLELVEETCESEEGVVEGDVSEECESEEGVVEGQESEGWESGEYW